MLWVCHMGCHVKPIHMQLPASRPSRKRMHAASCLCIQCKHVSSTQCFTKLILQSSTQCFTTVTPSLHRHAGPPIYTHAAFSLYADRKENITEPQTNQQCCDLPKSKHEPFQLPLISTKFFKELLPFAKQQSHGSLFFKQACQASKAQ